jgi:hypothetical protein
MKSFIKLSAFVSELEGQQGAAGVDVRDAQCKCPGSKN